MDPGFLSGRPVTSPRGTAANGDRWQSDYLPSTRPEAHPASRALCEPSRCDGGRHARRARSSGIRGLLLLPGVLRCFHGILHDVDLVALLPLRGHALHALVLLRVAVEQGAEQTLARETAATRLVLGGGLRAQRRGLLAEGLCQHHLVLSPRAG